MENTDKPLYNLRRLQLMQLDILKEVKRVCNLHGFKFFIMNGTCLGAIRHQGAIPWDDDVDIGMYVDDFDEFVKCQKDFSSKYFLQTIDTDPEFKTMIARVRLENTTIIEKEFENCDCNHGVFIDIYPLFGYPSNKFKAHFRSWESLLYRLLLAQDAPKNHGKIAILVGKMVHKSIPMRIKRHLIKVLAQKLRSESSDSKWVAFLYGMDVKIISTIKYPREMFETPSMLKYEDDIFPGPADWDGYLKLRYNDYMRLPPKEKRNSYHNFEYVDLDHSYLEYKGIWYLK